MHQVGWHSDAVVADYQQRSTCRHGDTRRMLHMVCMEHCLDAGYEMNATEEAHPRSCTYMARDALLEGEQR